MILKRTQRASARSVLSRSAVHGLRGVQSAVNVNQTIREALEDLRSRRIDHPVVYVYAIDDSDRLMGQVPTRALLFSLPETLVRDVMRTQITTITLDTSLDEALKIFAQSRLLALPVVDNEGRLVGAIDVEQFAQERLERSEQARVRQVFQTLGLAVDHPGLMTPLEHFRMRMPWLACNIGGGLLCALIAWSFSELLETVLILAFFLPLVLTLGESIAMQSLTITVASDPDSRTLATSLRALRNEACAAALLGLASGVVVALVSVLWGGDSMVPITMFAAVSISMVFAAVAGGAVPMLLHALRLDPSVASGPVALVIADTATTALYFTLGLFLLMKTAPAPVIP